MSGVTQTILYIAAFLRGAPAISAAGARYALDYRAGTHASLRPQRLHWIQTGRTTRRNQRSYERGQPKKQCSR